MPLPTPNNGEEQKAFLARCMANPIMNTEYPESEQRAAVCYSQWRKKMTEFFEPPDSGDAPAGVKNILKSVYDSCRTEWIKNHPSDRENQNNKQSCASIAWAAVKKAGWQNVNGEWKKMYAPEFLIKLSEGDLKEVKIFYPGKFNHVLYGKFDVTEKHLQHAVDNFNKGIAARKAEDGSFELPCNYNHPRQDGPEVNKASGWIKRLYLKGKELFASIEWTQTALEYIKNKEYRYISPEFNDNWPDEKGNKHGFTVSGLALTNYPFLKENQSALVIAMKDNDLILWMPENDQAGSEYLNKENIMEKELREMLKLKEDDDILESVKTLSEQITELTESNKDLTTKLESASGEIKTLKEGKKELSTTEKALDEANKRIIDLEQKNAKNEAEKLVDSYINCDEPKILPGQRERAVKMALKDPEGFKEFWDEQKPVLDLKEKGSAGEAPEGDKAFAAAIDKKISENKGMNYADAVKAVIKENPAFGKDYEPKKESE